MKKSSVGGKGSVGSGSKSQHGGNVRSGVYHDPHQIKMVSGFKVTGMNANQKMKSGGNSNGC